MKATILVLCLFMVACTTPQPIYSDLSLIKENISIQKEIADTLLDAVVPKDQKQIEAIMKKKMENEERYDRAVSALNRLVTYFQAEKDVGYLTSAIDFAKTSEIKKLFDKLKERKDSQ
jgi:hypothetical protein